MMDHVHVFFLLILTLALFNKNVTGQNDGNCGDNFAENCLNSTSCTPYSYEINTRCDYIKCCCTEQLEDPLMDYLNFQYCHSWSEIINAILLLIVAIYYFLILGNIADDYFAPIMAETSDSMGLSHNVAGVTFLAFGNGAPDISSSIAAIKQGGEQMKLGIGALLGAAVFDPILVSAVIATAIKFKKPPEVARRPFVRDCIFLFVAAMCVLIMSLRETVNLGEAIGLVAIYVIYVLSAIFGEVYSKWKKDKSPRKGTLTYKVTNQVIMPALGIFSNESMGNLGSKNRDDNNNVGYTSFTQSFAGGQYQSFGGNQQISSQHSFMPLDKISTNKTQTQILQNSITDDNEEESELLSDITDNYDVDKEEIDRHWIFKLFIFVIKGPTNIIDFLCRISIPLTDNDGWNDYIALISCITSPLTILYGFDLFSIEVTQSFYSQLWIFGLIFGILMSIITFYFIRLKYSNAEYNNKQITRDNVGDSLTNYKNNNEDLRSSLSSDLELIKPKMSASMTTENYLLRKNNNEFLENLDNDVKMLKKSAVFKYYFLLFGFLSAVAWINLAANELVNILTTLGIISRIDLGILGITVLAWGNSIGDLVADVGVSKKGFPKMGIAAAIAGPTLNVLIGIGLGTLIVCIDGNTNDADIPSSQSIFYGSTGVMLGITIYMVVVAASSWRLNKSFGYFLYCYYALFLVINIMAYSEIWFNVNFIDD